MYCTFVDSAFERRKSELEANTTINWNISVFTYCDQLIYSEVNLHYTLLFKNIKCQPEDLKKTLSRAKRIWKWLKSRDNSTIWRGECSVRTCAYSPRLLSRSVLTMDTQSPLKLDLLRHWQTKANVTRWNVVTKATTEIPVVMSFTNQDPSNP
jgi:hypothetical protein